MRTIAHGKTNELPMHIKKLYTTAEAAMALGLSQVRVRQFCQQRRIGRKYGSHWLITADEINAFQPAATGRPKKEAPK